MDQNMDIIVWYLSIIFLIDGLTQVTDGAINNEI